MSDVIGGLNSLSALKAQFIQSRATTGALASSNQTIQNTPPQPPHVTRITQGHQIIRQRTSELPARLTRLSEQLLGSYPQSDSANEKCPTLPAGFVGEVEESFNVIGSNLSRLEEEVSRLEKFA